MGAGLSQPSLLLDITLPIYIRAMLVLGTQGPNRYNLILPVAIASAERALRYCTSPSLEVNYSYRY